MRVATWNCAQGLNRKLPLVQELNADFCVIPEAGRDLKNQLPTATYQWCGKNKNKGLGIYSESVQIEIAPEAHDNWVFFLPLSIDRDRYRVLAVWAFNGRAGEKIEGGIGQPLAIIQSLASWLSEKPAFVMGDFNNSVFWDKPGKPTNFALVHEALESLGFKSAYHHHFEENLGDETKGTLFHRKKIDDRYHIDYIYTNRPKNIRNVEVGAVDDWLQYSDHIPLIVELQNDF